MSAFLQYAAFKATQTPSRGPSSSFAWLAFPTPHSLGPENTFTALPRSRRLRKGRQLCCRITYRAVAWQFHCQRHCPVSGPCISCQRKWEKGLSGRVAEPCRLFTVFACSWSLLWANVANTFSHVTKVGGSLKAKKCDYELWMGFASCAGIPKHRPKRRYKSLGLRFPVGNESEAGIVS